MARAARYSGEVRCESCDKPLPPRAPRSHRKYCDDACRQAKHRARKKADGEGPTAQKPGIRQLIRSLQRVRRRAGLLEVLVDPYLTALAELQAYETIVQGIKEKLEAEQPPVEREWRAVDLAGQLALPARDARYLGAASARDPQGQLVRVVLMGRDRL